MAELRVLLKTGEGGTVGGREDAYEETNQYNLFR